MRTSIEAVKAASAPLPYRASAATSPLALWHLLSLDAPTVAALWTWFIARAASASLAPAIPVAMFLAVWLLYAIDRLLDTRGSRPSSTHEVRHLFHLRHRPLFIAASALVAIALLTLLLLIPLAALRLYLFLGALLAGWFGIIHTRAHSETLPKELALGPFFAAAVFIPSVTSISPALLLTAAAFALLCTLNCLYIYSWEHEPHHAPSIAPLRWAGTTAHPSTRLCLRFLKPITLLAIALPLLLIGFAPALAPVQLAITIAAALLFLLHRLHDRLDPTHLRAAADFVLLTPLLLAPWCR